MATDQKPQKSLKKCYYPASHRLNVNVILSNMTFLMISAVLTQWITAVFSINIAVLLSKLCDVLLCNYKIYLRSFSILTIAVICYIRLSRITRRLGINMHHCAKFHENRPKMLQRYGYLTVFKMAAIRHLAF